MTFQAGNGSFAKFAQEIPRGNSVFQRVSPNNPSSGFGMGSQGSASAAPAPSGGTASTSHQRILYPDNALEFGALQHQAPSADITPADLGNVRRDDANRTDRNGIASASSNTFGGSKPFPSNSGSFAAQPATYATTSHVLPGFGSQPQQQPSTTSPPQQQSRFGAQQQSSFAQPSFSSQSQQQQGFGQPMGSQKASFGTSVHEENNTESQYKNAAAHVMPNSVRNVPPVSSGQSNAFQNMHSAQTEKHTGMTPVSQSYEQKLSSFTSAPQTPVYNNLSQQENKHVERTVTAEQIDVLMKYINASNFATSGFLEILADAGEKFVNLRNNYNKLNLREAHNSV